MGRRVDYQVTLRPLDTAERLSFLREHSGLPGPRGNLELVEAIVDEGDPALFDLLIETDEEYLVVCGTVGLGRRLAEEANGGVERRLRALATDERWRVREGVAMALQRLGDADPVRLRVLVDDWATDPHPLVQRAALAGLCEPRLLRTEESAAHALAICEQVTDALSARPLGERRDESMRKLRQALGYCWSVAVAADPDIGLPRFLRLAELSGEPAARGVLEAGGPGREVQGDRDDQDDRDAEEVQDVQGVQDVYEIQEAEEIQEIQEVHDVPGGGEDSGAASGSAGPGPRPGRVHDDPDVRWIVRENLKKARLARLLGPR